MMKWSESNGCRHFCWRLMLMLVLILIVVCGHNGGSIHGMMDWRSSGGDGDGDDDNDNERIV